MAIHIKHAETENLVRQLASETGQTITAAIRNAAQAALTTHSSQSLWEQTEDVRRMLAQFPRTGLTADKAFFDELSGEA